MSTAPAVTEQEPVVAGQDFRYDSYNAYVYAEVRPGTAVLDVGCATGRLGEALQRERGCACWGIEADAKAAARARESYRAVVSMDLDSVGNIMDLGLPQRSFDHIVFSDVLEHLKDPEGVLRRFLPLLAPNGTVVVSLPNIAFWRKRLMLLRGAWNYEERGICDSTHLRFFTRDTAIQLVRRAGLRVERVVPAGVGGRYAPLKQRLPGVFAAGFVIVGRVDGA